MSQRTLRARRSSATTAAPAATTPALHLVRVLGVVAAVALIVTLVWLMVDGDWANAPVAYLVSALLATALVLPLARRVGQAHVAVLYVSGLFTYTVLRGLADDTSIPVRALYVIEADRWLFLGRTPTEWLQARYFNPGKLRTLDWLTVQVHWSYFFVPHLAVLSMYIFRRDLFPRLVALLLGVFYGGLLVYYLAPTMPPWLAADRGLLPGVYRVMDFVGGQVDSQDYARLYDALGVPNPVAAMPSLHMAVTTALVLFSRRLHWGLTLLLAGYAALMAFSLVYMGEHYATDVLAGALLALLVDALLQWRARRRERPAAAPTLSPSASR